MPSARSSRDISSQGVRPLTAMAAKAVDTTTAEEEDIPPADGTLLHSTPSNPLMRPRKRLER